MKRALRTGHRRLGVVLTVPLAIWCLTALGMALVPRSATTAYRQEALRIDAAALFPSLPEVRALGERFPEARLVRFEARGPTAVALVFDDPWDEPAARLDRELMPLAEADEETAAAWGSAVAGESLTAARWVTRGSPSYAKLPLPAWRVDAASAALYFDPFTGELLHQATPAHFFEDLLKTIHVWDWSGRIGFRGNRVLTALSLILLLAMLTGVFSVRRLARGKGAAGRAYRLHQRLGLLLGAQVVLWVGTGLSVVWWLSAPSTVGVDHARDPTPPVAWQRLDAHPTDAARGPVRTVELTMLGDEPVFRLYGDDDRRLVSAQDGRELTFTEAQRDATVRAALTAPGSIHRWQLASGPQDLDYYFFAGPWPVWKAWYSEPSPGVLTVDAVTGKLHPPKTRRNVLIERAYKLHVLDWTSGVISYRREPALLAGIALLALLWLTGVRFWWRTRRTTGSRRSARRSS